MPRQKKLNRLSEFGLFLNWEIVLGAVLWFNLAGITVGKSPPPAYQSGLLACAVLVIYTLDRLWDLKKLNTQAPTDRLAFVAKNSVLLKVAVVIAILGAIALLIWSFDGLFLLKGIILCTASGIYLILQQRNALKYGLKEGLIAGIFSLAIWGFHFNGLPQKWMDMSVVVLLFFLTCFTNLALIAYLEYEQDLDTDGKSLAIDFGKHTTKWLTFALVFVLIVGCVLGIIFIHFASADVVLSMLLLHNVGHLLIWRFPPASVVFSRWLVDALFLLPVLYFI